MGTADTSGGPKHIQCSPSTDSNETWQNKQVPQDKKNGSRGPKKFWVFFGFFGVFVFSKMEK